VILDPIVDVGAYNVNGNSKKFFPNHKWIGVDKRAGPDIDIVLDAEELLAHFGPESIGTIICTDTLEHAANPIAISSQFFRVLKAGGFLLLTVPLTWPIHDFPGDYWRFTPECVKEILLRDFNRKDVSAAVDEGNVRVFAWAIK
jgi:predicted SAM-dependent methyltransferase